MATTDVAEPPRPSAGADQLKEPVAVESREEILLTQASSSGRSFVGRPRPRQTTLNSARYGLTVSVSKSKHSPVALPSTVARARPLNLTSASVVECRALDGSEEGVGRDGDAATVVVSEGEALEEDEELAAAALERAGDGSAHDRDRALGLLRLRRAGTAGERTREKGGYGDNREWFHAASVCIGAGCVASRWTAQPACA